jgi:hypothetical protein
MRETVENPMFRRVFLASLVMMGLGLGEASAQRYSRDNSQAAPLERMLPQIRRDYPGTFYDAEGPFPDEMGNPHYHIKWLTPEGRVIWLDTDARTGHVLGVNGSGWRAQQQFHEPPHYGGSPVYNAPPGQGRGWNRGNGWSPPRGWYGGGNNYHGQPGRWNGPPNGSGRWSGPHGNRHGH